MGRKPKEVTEVKEETKEEVKEVTEVKTKDFTLTASYKQKNEEDGTFERISHKGTGKTLADVVGSMKDYPKGLACNILMTIERNGKEVTKNVAPMKARAIMEKADEAAFETLFRGI